MFHINVQNHDPEMTDFYAEPLFSSASTNIKLMVNSYTPAESNTMVLDVFTRENVAPCGAADPVSFKCTEIAFNLYGRDKNNGVVKKLAFFEVDPYYYSAHKWEYHRVRILSNEVTYDHNGSDLNISINPNKNNSYLNSESRVNSILTIHNSTNNNDFIFVGSNQGMWISSNGGKSYNKFTVANGLSDNIVNNIAVTSDGSGVFVATPSGINVSYDGGNTFKSTLTVANGLGDNAVYSIATANGGKYIYAATNNGLSISTNGGQNFVNYTKVNGLADNTVYKVAIANNGQSIYAATKNGLSVSNDSGVTFKTYSMLNKISSNAINSVTVNENGNQIYLATNLGIDYTNQALSESSFTKPSNVGNDWSHNMNYNILLGNDKNIYVAGDYGLATLVQLPSFTYLNYFLKVPVYDVALSSDGKTIYAATDNGLYVSTDEGTSFVKVLPN